MMDVSEQAKARYVQADANRRFEIELFWKRSAFFWGFLTAALTAYFILLRVSEPMALLVSCFGTVAAYVWYLANRASAFWQKVWEQNVMADEAQVLGASVYDRIPSESELGRATPLIGWKRFSLSALITGFSLYTFVFCLVLSAIPALPLIRRIVNSTAGPAEVLPLVAYVLSLIFLVVMHVASTSHPSIPTRVEVGEPPAVSRPGSAHMPGDARTNGDAAARTAS
jgi:hypothetical protein